MTTRHRKLSMPLEFMELSPTKKINEEEITKDFYQKPYARCIKCLEFRTRCHKCFGKVLESLKSWKDEEKIKLKEPLKTRKKGKIIISKNEDAFNISNIALRKTQQNAEIVTFQQPVLHKNTILYCVKPFDSPQPKIRSTQVSPSKYRRNLLVNFSYRDDTNPTPKQQPQSHQIFTQLDTKSSKCKPVMNRLATTFMIRRRSVGCSSSMNHQWNESG